MSVCPKCSGRLITVAGSFRAPNHQSCINCGLYIEAETTVVMGKLAINPATRRSNQYAKVPRLPAEEKILRRQASQRRYQEQAKRRQQ